MSNENCSICLKEVCILDKTTTSCNHVFHFSCLYKNYCLNKHTGSKCPLCRNIFSDTTNTDTDASTNTVSVTDVANNTNEPLIVINRCICENNGGTYTPFIAGGPCRECSGYESGNMSYGLWDRNP